METLYDQLSKFSDLGAAVETGQFLLSLVLSFLLSVVVAKVYQISFRGSSYSPAFMQTLVISGMVVSTIMLLIGSNIARAFSLVGALSIVRYRNAVKDPRDVAFIFLVMGVGMACGTGFYRIAIMFTTLTGAAILALSAMRFGEQSDVERILRIEAPMTPEMEHKFDEVLTGLTKRFSLLSLARGKMGTELELTFSIVLEKNFKIQKLIEALSQVNNGLRIEVAGTTHTFDM